MTTLQSENQTVHGIIERAIAEHDERTALIDGPSGSSVDFGELGLRVDRIAGWLWHDGLRPGDPLALWAPNMPPIAAIMLASLRIGATVVPLSPAWTTHEAARMARLAGVSAIVTVPPLVDAACALGARRVIVLGASGGGTPLTEPLDHERNAPPIVVQPDHPAFVCGSSGTTGPPKGVVLTHRQMVAVCRQIADAFDLQPADATLAIAPWFHILGLTAELLAPLSYGATVISVPTFDPADAVALIAEHAVTYLAVPPPVAAAFVRHPSARSADLSSLQLVAVGGAPLPLALHDALAARLPGCAVGQGWGLTETSGALCIPTRTAGAPPGTVGRPLPGTELRVVDPDTSRPVESSGDGELICRGPQLMSGYLDAAEDTAAAFTDDGWLRTGDLGHIDANGNVVITGRLKDLIKVNALQVAPAEIEEALLAQPGISDAAVVGRPDERTGERPVAFVVTDRDVDLDAITDALRRRLASYKVPTEIRVVEQLPRSPSGKLLRGQLATGVVRP